MPRRKTEPATDTTDQGTVATLGPPAEPLATQTKHQLAELNIGPKPMKKLKDFDWCEDLAAYLKDFEGGSDGAFEFLKVDSSDAEMIRVELTRILGPECLTPTNWQPVYQPAPDAAPADPEPASSEPAKATPAPSTNGHVHHDDVGQLLMNEWRTVEEAEADWEAAKEEAAELKRVYDKRLENYGNKVRECRNPPLLFAQADRANSNGHAETSASVPADPATDESWRTVPLTEALIGLTDRIIEMLADAEPPLRTVGQLADYIRRVTSDGYECWYKEIRGIGQGTAEKIDKALEGFWERQRRAAPAPEAAAETSPEAEAAAEAAEPNGAASNLVEEGVSA